MTSLLILSSLVHPVTLLRKRIYAASWRVMYIYIYIYIIHIYIYICVSVYVYTHTHTHTHTYIYIYTHTHTHTNRYLGRQTGRRKDKQMQINRVGIRTPVALFPSQKPGVILNQMLIIWHTFVLVYKRRLVNCSSDQNNWIFLFYFDNFTANSRYMNFESSKFIDV